jgi:hypothetical protein
MSEPSKLAVEISENILWKFRDLSEDRELKQDDINSCAIEFDMYASEMVAEERRRCLYYFNEARMGACSVEAAQKAIESGEWPKELRL